MPLIEQPQEPEKNKQGYEILNKWYKFW